MNSAKKQASGKETSINVRLDITKSEERREYYRKLKCFNCAKIVKWK